MNAANIKAGLEIVRIVLPILGGIYRRAVKGVTYEEWYGATGRDRSMDQIIEERRRLAAGEPQAAPTEASYDLYIERPDGTRIPTALGVLVAAESGDIPDYFPPEYRAETVALREKLLRQA